MAGRRLWAAGAIVVAISSSHVAPAAGMIHRNSDSNSPWCRNTSADASVGMYGPIGASTGLTGPERQGVYVDVPLEVAGPSFAYSSLCTHFTRAGIEWRRLTNMPVCMARPYKAPHHSGQAEP